MAIIRSSVAVGGLLVSSLAWASDIDGTYTCLTKSERVPLEVYTETQQIKTNADGSVQLTTADGMVMTGVRNGQTVVFQNAEAKGTFTFGNGTIAIDTNFTEKGVSIHETSQCVLGNQPPAGNSIGAWVNAEAWGSGNNNWAGYDAFRLNVTIAKVPAATSCKANQVWVAAVTPSNQLFFYGPNGWSVNAGSASSDVNGAWNRQIFDATAMPGLGSVLRSIVGTDFYVGYGCSLDSMLSQGSLAKVYTLR